MHYACFPTTCKAITYRHNCPSCGSSLRDSIEPFLSKEKGETYIIFKLNVRDYCFSVKINIFTNQVSIDNHFYFKIKQKYLFDAQFALNFVCEKCYLYKLDCGIYINLNTLKISNITRELEEFHYKCGDKILFRYPFNLIEYLSYNKKTVVLPVFNPENLSDMDVYKKVSKLLILS